MLINSGKLDEWNTNFMKEMISILEQGKSISVPRYNIINKNKRIVSGELTLKQTHQLNIIKDITPLNSWQESFLKTIKEFIAGERSISDKQIQYLKPILERVGVKWNEFEIKEESQKESQKESQQILTTKKIFKSEDFAPLIPRDWQIEAYNKWYNEGKENASVEVYTGGGKSFLGSMIMQQNPDSNFMIVVHTLHLQAQWKDVLMKDLNISKNDIGFVNGEQKDFDKKITIAIINSVRDINLTKEYIIIFDETHHYTEGAERNNMFLQRNSHMFKKVLAMSATIKREDNTHKEFIKKYPIVYISEQGDGIKDGHICEYEVINKAIHLIPEEQNKYKEATQKIDSLKHFYGGGKYWFPNAMAALKQGDSTAAALISDNNTRKQVLLHTFGKIQKAKDLIMQERGQKIMVFSELQKSANELYDLLKSEGIECGKYHSGMPIKERRQMLEDFKNDKFQIMIGCKCLDEGVNIPAVSVAILISGTSVKRQQTQRLGRVLRKQKGVEKIARIYQLYVPKTQDEVWLRNRTIPFQGIAKSIRWE